MKTVFDKTTRDELITRINALNATNTAQWGKMNLNQMVKHCMLWEEMIQGDKEYKQAFIGRLFGKMALKKLTKDESPLQRNTPTTEELKQLENCNLTEDKAKWVEYIEKYTNFSKQGFIHPFFGPMTDGQIGILAYKHADHHLRQFGG